MPDENIKLIKSISSQYGRNWYHQNHYVLHDLLGQNILYLFDSKFEDLIYGEVQLIRSLVYTYIQQVAQYFGMYPVYHATINHILVMSYWNMKLSASKLFVVWSRYVRIDLLIVQEIFLSQPSL